MNISIFVSTVADGMMKTIGDDRQTAVDNRIAYLEKNSIKPDSATLHTLSYNTDDFCRYRTLTDSDKGDGITRNSTFVADAVVVTQPYHALLLPLADCIGAVIHDPINDILMLSHLGRHNLERQGGTNCIKYLIEQFNCDPADLTVWLSPAAGRENYPLYSFDNRGMHNVAIEQLLQAGVKRENVTTSPIDVTTDKNYFSHSQFLKGSRQLDGRFCVVAVLND